MNHDQFMSYLKDRFVRLEHASSGQPLATISVRVAGSNVVRLYQVPYAWVAVAWNLSDCCRVREWNRA
jgi:hypothetical protein